MANLGLNLDSVTKSIECMRIPSPSENACETIIDSIREFEATLDSNHEVGMKLASFGQPVMLNVTQIQPDGPCLIFRGFVNGQRATLVQNVSQLSFLLLAVPKPEPDKPARRIGFALE